MLRARVPSLTWVAPSVLREAEPVSVRVPVPFLVNVPEPVSLRPERRVSPAPPTVMLWLDPDKLPETVSNPESLWRRVLPPTRVTFPVQVLLPEIFRRAPSRA